MDNYFYCSKKIRYPIKDVVLAIYNYFKQSEKDIINLNEIYNYLREFFNAKSFNRANLVELLHSQVGVSFNTVKELYIQYVVNEQEEKSIQFEILNKIFIDNKDYIVNIIRGISLDTLIDILEHGTKNYINFLSELIDSKIEPVDITKPNFKLIKDFLKDFSEEELISAIESGSILQDIYKFKNEYKQKLVQEQFYASIKFYLQNIAEDNLKIRTKYYFSNPLQEVFDRNGILYISDFANLSYNVIQELYEFKENILHKLKSLQFSVSQKLNEEFKYLLQRANKDNKPNRLWQNYVEILENRANGATLEAASLDVTRERVRQLENQYLNTFFEFYVKYSTRVNVIRALTENDLFLSDKDIVTLFPFNPKLFKYFLANIQTEDLQYSDELGKFYYVDDYNWYDEVCEYAENMPEQINIDEIDAFVKIIEGRLKEKRLNIDFIDCKKIVVSYYKRIGEVLSKNKLGLSEKYKHIWREYFPEPINIYDSTFLSKFKKLYAQDFNDNKGYSDRSIVGNLTRIGILCGRGSYIINDRKFMSEELSNKIYNYIVESERDTFLTNTLFCIFKDELETEGINNKYFMQGALRQRCGDRLFFRRDYVSLTQGEFNIYSEILEYVKQSNRILMYDEIKEQFPGITDIVLNIALSQEGILWYRKKFVHVDSLNIIDAEIKFLNESLYQLLSDGAIHHASELLQYVQIINSDLLEKLYITEHFAFFSLVQYLFEDDFEFKRPFFAEKGVVISNQNERIKEFVYSKDYCSIDELLEYIYENNMHIYSILECIDSFDDYIMKDEKGFILTELTNVNKYNIELVENIVLKELGDNDFIFADNLKSITLLPTEVIWTPWLIYSAFKKYGKKLTAIPSNNQFKFKNTVLAKPIIVKRDVAVNNVDELIGYLKEKTKLSETEFYVYLRSKGLA